MLGSQSWKNQYFSNYIAFIDWFSSYLVVRMDIKIFYIKSCIWKLYWVRSPSWNNKVFQLHKIKFTNQVLLNVLLQLGCALSWSILFKWQIRIDIYVIIWSLNNTFKLLNSYSVFKLKWRFYNDKWNINWNQILIDNNSHRRIWDSTRILDHIELVSIISQYS